MQKPKVLYILNSANYSGAEIVMSRLIISNTDQITPFVICPPGNLQRLFQEKGITTIECAYLTGLQRDKKAYSFWGLSLKFLKNIFFISKTITRTIKSERIRIVHANNLTSSIYSLPSLFLSRLSFSKTKWLWSNHDINYLVDKERGNQLVKVLVFFFDKTIAVSNAVKKSMDSKMSNKKIIVLYNGINLPEFVENGEIRSKFRKQLQIAEDVLLLSIIGTIADYKGQDLLIEAFLNLTKNQNRKIALLIIGRHEDNVFLEKLKRTSLAIEKDLIFFLHHTDSIIEVYNAIDVLVNATKSYRSEPLGTTIIEAMAMKKIVVASNTGGSTEIIDDQKNGFIFDVDNVDSLTEKLNQVVNNYDSLTNIRQEAFKKISSQFEIQSMSQKYNLLITI